MNTTRQATVWNKETIKALLATNDRAVTKAVVAIYYNQTQDEISSKVTQEHNGKGFTKFDAKFLTEMATFAINNGMTLTTKQVECIRHRVYKYWRQLAEIANNSEIARQARLYDQMSNGA